MPTPEDMTPEGIYELAIRYYEGEGVEQSFDTAFKYYLMAAERGHATAMSNVGFMYDRGEGVERSAEKAFEWYKRSAELGCDVGALFQISLL